MSTKDKIFFLQTLSLAKKGRGSVAPNPEVGAIVVRDGKILGEGFHEYFGGAHAEVNAIQDAENNGHDVAGSQIFVSLEPCCHRNKKTPPCTLLLIEKKIAQVHIFFPDPNPKVLGRGAKILESAGIKIFWADEKLQLQENFFYQIFSFWIQKKTPFCTLKLAQSKNFYLGEKNTQVQITGHKCREFTLTLRDRHQGILVGSQTLLVDNPTLAGKNTQPIRIVLDGSGRLGGIENIREKKFFRDENFLVVLGEQNFLQASKIFGKEQCIACPFISLYENIFDLFALKKNLAQKNIASIFIEGGGKTAQIFLEEKQIEKFFLYESPLLLEEKNKKNYVKGVNPKDFSYLKEEENFFLGDDEVTSYLYK